MGRPKLIDDEQLLLKARELFARHGHSVSTREIAVAVGLSQATLFQRFGNKDALFVASMGLHPLDVAAVVGNRHETGSLTLEDQIVGLIHRLHVAVATVLPAVFHASAAPHLDPGLVNTLHQHLGADQLVIALKKRVMEWRRRGLIREEVDAKRLVDLLLWLVHGRVLARMSGPTSAPAEDEAEVRTLARMVCWGIGVQS